MVYAHFVKQDFIELTCPVKIHMSPHYDLWVVWSFLIDNQKHRPLNSGAASTVHVITSWFVHKAIKHWVAVRVKRLLYFSSHMNANTTQCLSLYFLHTNVLPVYFNATEIVRLVTFR